MVSFEPHRVKNLWHRHFFHTSAFLCIFSLLESMYKGFFRLISKAGQDYVRTWEKKECRGVVDCSGWIRKKKITGTGWGLKGSLEVVWSRAGCPGLYSGGFWMALEKEDDSVILLQMERLGMISVIPCWEMFLFCSAWRQQRTISSCFS